MTLFFDFMNNNSKTHGFRNYGTTLHNFSLLLIHFHVSFLTFQALGTNFRDFLVHFRHDFS